jgi:ligand-binding sensor protein/AraC-like DNA-binding protein
MDAIERLKSVINIEKWQLVQDALSDVTGMSIVTADYRGVPITEHSGCRAYCRGVREDPALTRLCQKCDSRGGLEAIRAKAPYIYRCHMNVVDAAIPIIIDNSYLGSILIGQVLLPEGEQVERLEMICPGTAPSAALHGRTREGRRLLPVFSLERIEMIVTMLFHLCNYFVGEAIEKKAILRLISDVDRVAHAGAPDDVEQKEGEGRRVGASGLEHIKKNLNHLITDALASCEPPADEAPELSTGNRMVKSVFSYINLHRAERLSLHEMAHLCHVSPSYFSRLFRRETGETYSAFLIRKRVEWGKALLLNGDMKIAQIAEESGFSDAGHFIRSFKKYEGVTPSLFRSAVVGGRRVEDDVAAE